MKDFVLSLTDDDLVFLAHVLARRNEFSAFPAPRFQAVTQSQTLESAVARNLLLLKNIREEVRRSQRESIRPQVL